MPSLVEIGPAILEKRFFKFVNVFYYFLTISPWKRAGSFNWINLNSLHPWIIYAKFGWNWPSGSGEEIFVVEFINVFFCNFVIISPWKRVGPFIRTNLNPLHPRMLCAKFGWNLGLEKKMKMWKVYDNGKDNDINNGQRTNFDQKFSSGELKRGWNDPRGTCI